MAHTLILYDESEKMVSERSAYPSVSKISGLPWKRLLSECLLDLIPQAKDMSFERILDWNVKKVFNRTKMNQPYTT